MLYSFHDIISPATCLLLAISIVAPPTHAAGFSLLKSTSTRRSRVRHSYLQCSDWIYSPVGPDLRDTLQGAQRVIELHKVIWMDAPPKRRKGQRLRLSFLYSRPIVLFFSLVLSSKVTWRSAQFSPQSNQKSLPCFQWTLSTALLPGYNGRECIGRDSASRYSYCPALADVQGLYVD